MYEVALFSHNFAIMIGNNSCIINQK